MMIKVPELLIKCNGLGHRPFPDTCFAVLCIHSFIHPSIHPFIRSPVLYAVVDLTLSMVRYASAKNNDACGEL